MDDEPMWASDRVVAPTPGFAITILETANEFAIKALFDRLLGEIRAFSQHENESLTDAWLHMKEMLRNCHGHNLSKGNIIKIFYHGLSVITQEVLNVTAGADLGASINRMSYSLYAKLSLETLKPTKMCVRLDDISFQYPVGIAENMLVEVVFRVKQKQLNHGVGIERMIFYIDSAIKHSYSNDDTCFSVDVIDEILEEDFDALLDKGRKILYSVEGTLLEEEIFVKFDEFMEMTTDDNSESESDTEEPPFEKIIINTDYKIKACKTHMKNTINLKFSFTSMNS
nr:reverse transcriptase domain-containing protein [Tanacetum cinerariifolium]GEX24729.1 reverse transcriptase domain-containing protein [Tanacetum cinerariifolium]